MHQLNEKSYSDIRGRIYAEWRKPAAEAGKQACDRHNVITFSAAEIMAHLIGGDMHFRPSHIGFIYADNGNTMANPSTYNPKRLHSWGDIASDIEAVNGNMLLSPLMSNASYATSGDETHFNNNAVTLASKTDSDTPLVFSGGGYAAVAPVSTDKYFQVVLLSQIYEPNNPTVPKYIPFARAQLADGDDGLAVQTGHELAVYWTITFN